MYLAEGLQKKWAPVLDHPDMPEIKDPYKKAVTAILLENQEKALAEEGGSTQGLLQEAVPVNSTDSTYQTYQDPILISMIRRSMPNLIAYDVCGVQPMTGPTGLIFALRAKYSTQSGTESLVDEADTSFTSSGSHINSGTAGVTGAQGGSPALTLIQGLATATAEALGDSPEFAEMAFAIDKVTVTAKSRALKGEYTMELAQDLKAVHGLDAETELANIISQEVLAEINREVMRTIYFSANHGAQHNTSTAGVFDLDVDSNGRWSVEKFKGLLFQIERDANAVAEKTRRGKGNVIICAPDVASALSMGGVLDSGGALNVDSTGNTFVGTLGGRYKVFIDPYANASATNFYVVGYKGSSAYDAGIFYCPYIPLQMVRAVGENSFQPKIGFKTRYGMVSKPFANSTGNGVVTTANDNYYYRIVRVDNLM
ncbi:ATP-binding protein [Marine Group I thaumarchaeote]|uniref:ATP-binding protein n=1 Tax=Marine Group I thaumarchaeote TaxID=2511932 RepID=A0A7K4MR62_9ARCH|nr:ATP-binding protein [Marine Group I thaumarchaeote]